MEEPETSEASQKPKIKRNKLTLPLTKALVSKRMKKIRKIKKQNKNKTTENENSEHDEENLKVDFNALSIHTLRKYRKFYNMPIASNLNKSQLAKEVNKHFPAINIETEKTIITYFIHFARNDTAVKEEEQA